MSIFAGKSKNVKITIILVSALSLLMLVFGLAFCYYGIKASANSIYNGVKVGTVNLGGMNKTAAKKALMEKYNMDNINVTINCEGKIFYIYGSSFSLKIDYDATIQKAISYGKAGSLFSKIKNMRSLADNPQQIGLVLSCNKDALQNSINETLGDVLRDVQEYSVEFGKNELVVSNGKSGKVVYSQKILDAISNAIINNTLSDTINVNTEIKKPHTIDAEKFFSEYNREAEDATVQRDGNKINIISEVIGAKLNKQETIKIINENKNSFDAYTIPAQILYPKITASHLEAEYVDTIIGTYSTNYASGSENRKTNIHLASQKINGFVINPGEVFSFNNVVGPRTEENGYKMAQSYSGSKVIEDLGGGICQVSSTLYNAVVFADLEIVFRTNHTIPVSYTPLGRDATVSYGSIDFKFKNNKDTPVKIEVLHDGSNLTVNVYGRKKYVKDISIESKITDSVPFSVTEIKDDTLPRGETVVEQTGSNGTIVESYKTVKEEGVVVSHTFLARSVYIPRSKVVRVGTKARNNMRVPSGFNKKTEE